MNRIALGAALAVGAAVAAAAAEPLQTFNVIGVQEAYRGLQVMAVSPERVTTNADGHKVFPIYVVSDDGSVDTTVLEVDCAAGRRRVVSESVLFIGSSEPIDKTSANILSWGDYGSDAPADKLACDGPGEQDAAGKFEAVNLKAFAAQAAATLRHMLAEKARK